MTGKAVHNLPPSPLCRQHREQTVIISLRQQKADANEIKVRRKETDYSVALKVPHVSAEAFGRIYRLIAHPAYYLIKTDIPIHHTRGMTWSARVHCAAFPHGIAVEVQIRCTHRGMWQCFEQLKHEEHILRDYERLEAHSALKQRGALYDARHAAPSERMLHAEIVECSLEEHPVWGYVLVFFKVVVAVHCVHAHRYHVGALAVTEITIAQCAYAAGQETVVGINKLDVFAAGLTDAAVACCRHAAVLLLHEAYVRVLRGVGVNDFGTIVSAAVVDDHYLVFVSGKALLEDGVEACADIRRTIV